MRTLPLVLLLSIWAGSALAQVDREDAILENEARFFATPRPKPTGSPSPTPSPTPTPGAEAEIDAAQAHLKAGDPELARERLQRAIAKDPAHPRVQEFAAKLGLTRQDIADATRRMQKEDLDQALAGVGWLSFFLGPLNRLDLTWAVGLVLVTLVAVAAIFSFRRRK